VASGFPAVAVLLCLESREQMVGSIDGFIDALHRLLRDRRTASMALLCLARVVACFLRRMSPRSDAREWLLTLCVSHVCLRCVCCQLLTPAVAGQRRT
jgi:hypothetical protein